MSVPSHFFTAVFTKVDAALATYVDDVAVRVIDWITPLSAKLLAVYVVMWGYSMLRGMVQEPVKEGAFRIVRAAAIIGLIKLTNYHVFLADFFLTAPDQIAATISGQTTLNGVHFLDDLWTQQQAFGDAFWDKGTAAGISGIGLQLVALLLYGFGLAASGIAAVLLLLSKIGLHVWLAIGPAFVLLALFEATKQFTNSWLGQCVTFGVLPMLTSAVIYLLLSLCKSYLSDAAGVGAMSDPGLNQTAPVFFLCGAAVIFLVQIPSYASGLGGGVAISTLGAMTAAYRAVKGAAGGAKNLMTGQTLSDMRGARRQRAKNLEWAKENPGLAKRTAGLPMAAYRKLTSLRKNTVTKS
jgi:type IV secretion system protein VirB6